MCCGVLCKDCHKSVSSLSDMQDKDKSVLHVERQLFLLALCFHGKQISACGTCACSKQFEPVNASNCKASVPY